MLNKKGPENDESDKQHELLQHLLSKDEDSKHSVMMDVSIVLSLFYACDFKCYTCLSYVNIEFILLYLAARDSSAVAETVTA